MATEEINIRYPAGLEHAVHLTKAEMEQHIRLMAAFISKIEAGVLKISLLPTSINALVEKCLFWIPQLPGGQGIEIDARLPARPVLALADAGRLQQVLENLVSNAIKFSSPGGRVTIELIEREREVEVVVSDQGKGIAPADLERIFGKFTQVEDSATRAQGGTGLGLAICKGIIEAHRGRLWAESEIGKGSRFHFTVARAESAETHEENAEIAVAPLLSTLRTPPGKAPR
jgi:signal transduction histidine kinase